MSKPSNLVIVESPSKAKTIGKYLGPDYVVKASMGHLRDLPKSVMGVDLETFDPHYIPVKARISFSRSTTRRVATDWTLPALRPLRTFFHSSGERV